MMGAMALLMFHDLLVSKKPITVRRPDGSSTTYARLALLPHTDAVCLRNLSALVSAGYLLPDQEQSRGFPTEAGANRPLAARRRAPQAYSPSVRKSLAKP